MNSGELNGTDKAFGITNTENLVYFTHFNTVYAGWKIPGNSPWVLADSEQDCRGLTVDPNNDIIFTCDWGGDLVKYFQGEAQESGHI